MSNTDSEHCRAIVRAHARTFWLASRLLPAPKRRAAYAVYAFCRVADDVADTPAVGVDPEETLRSMRTSLVHSAGGSAADPVFRELTHAMGTFHIPIEPLQELLDGVARDCQPVAPSDWAELERYCQGVASSVGEICTFIFGVDGGFVERDEARRRARTLGVAMQLTNILRDVGEDAARGRCYLPAVELAAFDLARADVLGAVIGQDPRWRAFMRFQIERARKLYDDATPGIALLSADARRCATACAIGYAGILNAIESIDYDTFRTRARLSGVARAAVLWNAWRVPTRSAGARA